MLKHLMPYIIFIILGMVSIHIFFPNLFYDKLNFDFDSSIKLTKIIGLCFMWFVYFKGIMPMVRWYYENK